MFYFTAPDREFEVALKKGINDNLGLGIYGRRYFVLLKLLIFGVTLDGQFMSYMRSRLN